ncbi:MAG TPA: GAF domain-containing protein, partial [candidate division Zixibacteria bacterium]|nr:GAF domain-containing protein [candidate division Zixibacteria bacterium]
MKPLWGAVMVLGALGALILGLRRDKRFLLSFFAFLLSASFFLLPDLFGLENQLLLFGEGLSVWAAAFFALAGFYFAFRTLETREEKVIVEAVPLAEFFRSLKELLVHPHTLVEVFNLSLREICRLWGTPAGAVFIYHSGTDELLLAASFGLSREQEKKWEKIRAKEELFSRSAKTGMSLVIGDLAHSRKTWAALAPFVNFGSLVSIPMVGRERVLGVLVLLATEPYRFGRVEEEELGPVGLSLGMFADGVRLMREGRRRSEETMAWRQELEKTLSGMASISKGDALHNLLDLAAARMPYRLGLILTLRQGKWEVVSASLEPLVGDRLSPVLAETVSNGCQTPEPKRLYELQKLSSLFEHPHELPPITEALLLPLLDDRKTVGAILLGFEGAFPNGDYVLSHLSALAGVAVALLSQPASHSENWVGALQTLATIKREEELRSFVDFALITFFHFDTGFLFRLEDDKLRLVKNWGYPAFNSIVLELEEGVWGHVAAERTPIVVSREKAKEFMETVNRAAFDQILKATGGIGLPVSQMTVPLTKGGKVWGVLSLERYRHSFTPADFEKFAALAELVSIKLSALEQKELGLDGGVAIGNEINNELTAIIGNLELTSAELPDGSPLREKLEELVGLAQRTGEKVGQLAKNLSSLAGQNRDINRLLDEVVEAERANLEADLSHLPEVRVDSDKLKGFLREVIHELMAKGESNALSLKTDTDNQYVYIRLLSKNPELHTEGIAGVSFGQIFRSDFSRLEESLSPTDLGWITEAGGQVSLVEDQVAGRSLTLRFPIPKAAKKGWKKSLKILAIDDQEIIRDLLVNMFGSAGHEVTTAERGEEGIAKFKIQRFDLVVT